MVTVCINGINESSNASLAWGSFQACRTSLWDKKWIMIQLFRSIGRVSKTDELSTRGHTVGLTWSSTLTYVIKLVMVTANYSCVAQWARRRLSKEDFMGKLKGSTFPPQNNKLDVYEEDSFCAHTSLGRPYIFSTCHSPQRQRKVHSNKSNAHFRMRDLWKHYALEVESFWKKIKPSTGNSKTH